MFLLLHGLCQIKKQVLSLLVNVYLPAPSSKFLFSWFISLRSQLLLYHCTFPAVDCLLVSKFKYSRNLILNLEKVVGHWSPLCQALIELLRFHILTLFIDFQWTSEMSLTGSDFITGTLTYLIGSFT